LSISAAQAARLGDLVDSELALMTLSYHKTTFNTTQKLSVAYK